MRDFYYDTVTRYLFLWKNYIIHKGRNNAKIVPTRCYYSDGGSFYDHAVFFALSFYGNRLEGVSKRPLVILRMSIPA